MDTFRVHAFGARLLTGVWLACAGVAVALVCATANVQAQEQFYTQSGGRGLQNAKTNARVTKVETDVGDVKAQVAKIQPFAFAQLGNCSEDGEKLRWDGRNWICESEADPTVQPWAKKALPSCGAGSILGVTNGTLGCVTVGFVSAEVDPTVQNWAKNPLPSCGIGEVLSVGADRNLSCTKDFQGLMTEKDPYVHDFARTDIVPALPNCSTNEFLTMMGGRLSCRTYTAGILEETDPKVQTFARNDIPSAVLNACGAGQVLTAVSNGGNVVLQCQNAGGNLAETLRLVDLSDVTYSSPVSDDVLKFNGSGWTAARETDPVITSVSACGANEVLTWDGSHVTCRVDAGTSGTLALGGLMDVNVAGATDGNLLQYSAAASKWVKSALPTCGSGKVLSSDGVNFSCVNDAGSSGDPVNLNELGDVRTSPLQALLPADRDMLRWEDASGKWKPVHDKLSGSTYADGKWCRYVSATATVECDRGGPLQCSASQLLHWDAAAGAFDCVSATAALGLGTMATQNADSVAITGGTVNGVVIGNSNPAAATFTNVNAANMQASGAVLANALQVSSALVQGYAHVTGNLQVDGNFSISGSQVIDGVLFANGGITMPGLLEGGAVSVTYLSGTLADIRTLHVTNDVVVGRDVTVTRNIGVLGNGDFAGDVRIGGNLYVSGSQSLDGVLFANGGIIMPGVLEGGAVSVTNVSGTVADIRMLRVTNDALVGRDVTVTRNLRVNGDTSLGNDLAVGRDASVGRNLTVGTDLLVNRDITATRNLGVNGDVHINGNLYVSGSQSIDGVLFANGGIVMPGTLTSENVSATNISGSVADIRMLRVTNAGGVSGGLVFRDQDGAYYASSGLSISSTTGSLGIGAGAPAYVGNNGLYAAGSIYAAANVVGSGMVYVSNGPLMSVSGSVPLLRVASGFSDPSLSIAGGYNMPEAMRIVSTGNVGIGTSNPSTKLEVNGTISATNLFTRNISATGNATVAGDLHVGGNFSVSGSQTIDGVLFANGGITMPGSLTSSNISATNLSATIADIRALRLNNQVSGGLVYVDQNGLASTSSTFMVSGSTAMFGGGNLPAWGNSFSLFSTDGVYGGSFSSGGGFWPTSGYGLNWNNANKIIGDGSTGSQYLAFTTSGTEAMRIVSNSNVGIGTSNPTAKLEVNGNISASTIQTSGTVYAGHFVGDGSGLTGVVAASSDRITSGTTNVVANGASGYVSFTSAGSTTGYYSPAGVFAAVAVSTTTSGNFVDVSTTRNSTVGGDLAVAGTVGVGGNGGETCALGSYGKMRYVDVGSGVYRMQFCRP